MRWTSILLFLMVASLAEARQDFYAPLTPGTPIEEQKGQTPQNQLRPYPTGVIYMMSKKGLEVINPAAPKSMGMGQTVLAQPPSHTTQQEAVNNKKSFGGIRLFGWAF